MSLRLRLYVGAVVVAAAAMLALHVPADLDQRILDYAAWTVLAVLSEAMWMRSLSGQGTYSMSSTVALASGMLLGQSPAMWIAAVATLMGEMVVQRKPWVRAVFNSAQIVVTMWLAVGAWGLLGGPRDGLLSLPVVPAGAPAAGRLLLPMLGIFVAYLLVNRGLVAVAMAWSTGRPYLRVLREDWFYPDLMLSDAAAFLLSPLMVISFLAIRYPGVLLFFAPIWMIHENVRRYLELQGAQQQLILTERMAAKGEMAAEVGHELRNQLAVISARAQLLLRDAERGATDNVARNAAIVLEQTRRMEALSKGLMDFSRAELKMEPVDLNQLVQRSVEFVRGQNRFDGVEWDLRLAEPGPQLTADPGQLQQVLLNLFLNAADAMNERAGGRRVISVTSSADDRRRQARLVVSDTGPGIAAANLARVFEPRFTTKADGHGFGLSTSYRIVTNHGGRITAESPPGQGASFAITLPYDRAGAWGLGA